MRTSLVRCPHHRSRTIRALNGIVALAATITAVVGLLGSAPAGAQETDATRPGFTVTPYSEGNVDGVSSRSAIVIDASPGQTISDRVSVFNFTNAPISFLVYPADALPARGTGAFSLQLPDPDSGAPPVPTDAGSWITVPVTTITAEPGTRTDIPITIAIPLDAEPGDHAAGVVALNAEAQEGGGDLKIDVKRAVGARVYVRVDGPLSPELTVSDVSVPTGGQAWLAPIAGPSDATAKFTITNTGNVRMTPTVTVKVKDMFGRTVKTVEVPDFQELIPGASVDATATLGDLSGFGPRYTLEVTTSSPEATQTSSASFWVVPWLLILLIVVAVATFVVVRRRNRPATGSTGDGGGPGGERDPSSPATGPATTGLVGASGASNRPGAGG